MSKFNIGDFVRFKPGLKWRTGIISPDIPFEVVDYRLNDKGDLLLVLRDYDMGDPAIEYYRDKFKIGKTEGVCLSMHFDLDKSTVRKNKLIELGI